MTDQTAGLVSCQTTQLPHTRSAECANATEFRRVPTMAERLSDSRLCGHTPDQHRHQDGQAADARSQDRRIRELRRQLDDMTTTAAGFATERDDARIERDLLARDHASAEQVATFRQGVIDQYRAELGAAGEVLAVVRDAQERVERALATYDTQPGETCSPPCTLPKGHPWECNANQQPHEDPSRLREQLAEAHADCARYATERDEARAELDNAKAVVEAAKLWRWWHGNTNAAYADACQALEAAVDALRGEVIRYRVLTMPAEVVATYPAEQQG